MRSEPNPRSLTYRDEGPETGRRVSGYPFFERVPTNPRHNDSKLTIPTIKQSLTPSPFEQTEHKRVSADFSKSQVVQGGDRHSKRKKPTKSAIFGSEMIKLQTEQDKKDGKDPQTRHQKNISNLTNELRSLHTYKNSNLSQKKQMRFEKIFNANCAEKVETGSGDSNSAVWTQYNLKKQGFIKSLSDLKKIRIKEFNPKMENAVGSPNWQRQAGDVHWAQRGQHDLAISCNLKSELLLSPKLESSTIAQHIRIHKKEKKNKWSTANRTSVHLKANRRVSNVSRANEYGSEKSREGDAKEQPKAPKKKPCFKQLLYTNKDLNEAYEELLKKNGKEKEEDRKKTRRKTKSRPVTPKSVNGVKKRVSQVSGQVQVERKRATSRSRTPKREEHLDLGKMTGKLRKVSAKVNTGLKQTKRKEIRREKMDEFRRVKKDFMLNGVVLPEMHPRIESDFQKLETCEPMGEILQAFEPKNVDFGVVQSKIEADRVDYISALEPKENIPKEFLHVLRKYRFNFGEGEGERGANEAERTSIDNFNIFGVDRSQSSDADSEEIAPSGNRLKTIFAETKLDPLEAPHKGRSNLKRKSNIFTIDLDNSDREMQKDWADDLVRNRSKQASKGSDRRLD